MAKNNILNRGFGICHGREEDPEYKGLFGRLTMTMKRLGNIYHQICSIENLELADVNARKKKGHQPAIKEFDKDRAANLAALRDMLLNKTYKTSEYTTFIVYEPKEREVYRLPYYPDRIAHWAIMNVLAPVFTAMFTADSYSGIKGKGIHPATYAVRKALKDVAGTRYCLKIDVRKFYPNVDHAILKQLLRRKFRDNDLLWLLDEIIDSAEGLPIGNYLSMYFSNFYLTYLDHWIKEVKGVKNYFRYMDDIVILGANKPYLHGLLADIGEYLTTKLKLTIKGNYQLFPVDARGIDFVGYVKYHTHVRLRKSIKKTCARKLKKNKNPATIASYKGWLTHCNGKHLTKKLLNENIQGTRNNSGGKRVCGRKDKSG